MRAVEDDSPCHLVCLDGVLAVTHALVVAAGELVSAVHDQGDGVAYQSRSFAVTGSLLQLLDRKSTRLNSSHT